MARKKLRTRYAPGSLATNYYIVAGIIRNIDIQLFGYPTARGSRVRAPMLADAHRANLTSRLFNACAAVDFILNHDRLTDDDAAEARALLNNAGFYNRI